MPGSILQMLTMNSNIENNYNNIIYNNDRNNDFRNSIMKTNNGNTVNDILPRGYEMITRQFIKYRNNDSNKYKIKINLRYDLCTPKQIMCYNCSDDFEIKSITLYYDFNPIIKIPYVNSLNNVINFVENIRIPGDNKLYKTYYLDKTKLFFEINLLGALYNDISIEITTSGNCDNIKLNSEYCYLSNVVRSNLSQIENKVLIKNLLTGNVINYNSNFDIKLEMSGIINGFILSNINPDIINKIDLKLNNLLRIQYKDKYEIITNTTRINDKSLYINLNLLNYDENISTSSLDTHFIDNITLNLGLDTGHNNLNFQILCYSNNIISYNFGSIGLQNLNNSYSYSSDITVTLIDISDTSQINNSINISKWDTKNKKLEGNVECPVTFLILDNEYIMCSQCKKNFNVFVKKKWIDNKKNCPMCRTNWNNFYIYKIQNI